MTARRPDHRPAGATSMATAIVLVGGCAHFHLDRNAPGLIDVGTRPGAALAEEPGDPGEHRLAINPGFLGGVGVAQGSGESPLLTEAAAELTVHHGISQRGHVEDSWVYLERPDGVTVGWSFERRTSRGDMQATAPGPLYLLVHTCRVLPCLGAGYAFNPSSRDHGPQADAFLGPVFVRARYLFDASGGEIQVGLQIKFPLLWFWNR
jgi:hypothetical protein